MTETRPANKPPNLTDPSPAYFLRLESPFPPRKKRITDTRRHCKGGAGSCRIVFREGVLGEERMAGG